MAKFFEKLSAAIDQFRGRYWVFVADTDDRRSACIALRRTGAQPALADEAELDARSVILGCQDASSGRVVATIRLTPGHRFDPASVYAQELLLDRFPAHLHDQLVVASHLLVAEEVKSELPELTLLQKWYTLLVDKNHVHNHVVACMACAPSRYQFYRRLGFRPLGRIRPSAFGGYRLPLFLVVHDYDHLYRVGSPLLELARQEGFPKSARGIDWYHEHASSADTTVHGFALVSDTMYGDMNAAVLHGISEAGRQSLIRNAVVLTCARGEVLSNHGGGERNMGFVLEGALEVQREQSVVHVLGEGDLFGELAFILGIPRTADLVAAVPDTKVVLLGLQAVERLSSKDDRIQFWRNVSEILARRLAGGNLSDE